MRNIKGATHINMMNLNKYPRVPDYFSWLLPRVIIEEIGRPGFIQKDSKMVLDANLLNTAL